MYHKPNLSLWIGRDDPEDGPLAVRWHHRIQAQSLEENSSLLPTTALLSVHTDLGVQRNKGRVGQAQGPNVLRKYLGNLAWHHDHATIADAGGVQPEDDNLEALQAEQTRHVLRLLDSSSRVIVLGGGHEIVWGNFLAMIKHHPGKKIGVINLDAHFDNRLPIRGSTSGTSFYQIYEYTKEHAVHVNLLTLGIQPTQNTSALFQRARNFGHIFYTADEVRSWTTEHLNKVVQQWSSALDVIYLTLCLDVLDSSIMSAVSAPCTHGLTIQELLSIITAVKESGKLHLADVAEYNPSLDYDYRGARVVAYVINLFV